MKRAITITLLIGLGLPILYCTLVALAWASGIPELKALTLGSVQGPLYLKDRRALDACDRQTPNRAEFEACVRQHGLGGILIK